MNFDFFRKSKIVNTFVLAFTFALIFVGTNLKAQSANYSKYETLFSGSSIGSISLKLVEDANGKRTGNVAGFEINNFSYDFGSDTALQDSEVEAKWKLIEENTTPFIARVCETAENDGVTNIEATCQITPLPYRNGEYLYNPKGDRNAVSLTRKNTEGSFTKSQVVDFDIDRLSKTGENTVKIDYKPTGKTYKISLMYCAVGSDIDTDRPGTGVYLPEMCDDGLYFTMASISTRLPASVEEASSLEKVNSSFVDNQTTSQQKIDDILPTCVLAHPISFEGTFMGCLANVAYFIYWITNWLAGLMGSLFDFFLGYSIDSGSYTADFIESGWRVVRDISNIFFIIILVFTGFSVALGAKGTGDIKKILPTLIINAVLINFSLLGVKMAIDLSNIVARVFYTSMEVCSGTCKTENGKVVNLKTGDRSKGGVGYAPLSEKLVESFNPQRLFAPSVLDTKNITDPTGRTTGVGITKNKTVLNSNDYAIYFGIVSLISAAIMFAMILMFWKVAFIFLGRVIGLYMTMIFAPFAVMSRDLPWVGGMEVIGFKEWVKELSAYITLAPAFVFFLYIVYKVINTGFLNVYSVTNDQDINFFTAVIGVSAPMLIVYFMLDNGAKLAQGLAGKMGERFSTLVQKGVGVVGGLAVGGAIGVAAGTTALAGRTAVSSAGRGLGNSSLGKWAAENNNWFARKTRDALNWTQNSSMDVRKLPGSGFLQNNTLYKGLGLNVSSKASDLVGLGESKFEGGYKGQQKRRQSEIKKKLESKTKIDYMTKETREQFWKEHLEKKAGDKATDKAIDAYLKSSDTEHQTRITKSDALTKDIEGLTKEISKLDSDIKTGGLSDADKATKISKKSALEKDLKDKNVDLSKIQKLSLQAVEDIKNDDSKLSDAQKSKEYKDTYEKDIENLKKKYGKIGSNEDLSNALKLDYLEELRDNSIWSKKGLWGLGLGGGTSSGVAGSIYTGLGLATGLGVSSGLGILAADRIRFEQEAFSEAVNSSIKSWKSKGKSSQVEKYKTQLDELKTKMKESLEKPLGKSAKDITDDELDDAKDALKKEVDELYGETEVEKIEYDKLKKNTTSTRDQIKAGAIALQEKVDKYNKLKNIYKEKSELEEKIKKEEEKKEKEKKDDSKK